MNIICRLKELFNVILLIFILNVNMHFELYASVCGHFSHYENTPMQYTAIFHGCKNDNFQMKFFDIFLIFAQNIDCGYTLEPPQRGGSNEYPQSMLWSKNKKNMYTRVNPTFSI